MKHLAFWTERSSTDDSLRLVKELATAHAQKGGLQGDSIASLIASGDYLGLCEYKLDYATLSVPEAINCRQALAFFKKCTYLPLGVDREERAKSKFVKAELKCRETNELFDLRDQGLINLDPWADAALSRAKAKISRILGKLPRISELDFKFGPGATTLTKKSQASVAEKLQAGFSCSEDLLPYSARIIEEMPAWIELHQNPPLVCEDYTGELEYADHSLVDVPVIVTHGRVVFVPKDATTDRSIIVEGSLNVLIQGAIGRYMTARLKASGIDLSDQSRNQRLALEGSITGGLATLDLVSASDMMANAIVRELLPWEWWFFLSTMRSSNVELDGTHMSLEKFSSMGNGFTFPLQSLIFYALAFSVSQSSHSVVSVYGDDIICETRHATAVMRMLNVCGFEVNTKKSYWAGPFRESCGADYLSGIDIRPWYHREMFSPADLFRLHNFYVRHGDYELAELIAQQINVGLRIYGPDGYGDGHLLGEWSPRKHKRALSHGYGGVLFDTFRLKPLRDKRFGRRGDRVLPCYSIYVRENAETVLPVYESWSDADYGPVTGSSSSRARLTFWKAMPPEKYALHRNAVRRFQSRLAVEPLPEVLDRRSGDRVKALPLPGTQGYLKVSIYTFDAS